MLRLTPDCEGPPGAMTEIVIIEYFGVEAEFTFATANGILLTCFETGVDTYHCQGLPGDTGAGLMVTANFSDETSMTQFTTFPTCDGPVDFDLPWVLVVVGCRTATEYYAVIETHHDYEFTDSFRFESVPDVPEPKTCGLEAGRPSRWYCSFPINDWYTTLTFCAEIDGTGEYCETFAEEEFGAILPPRARCSGPDDDGPDDNGGGDPGSGYCIVETQGSCGSNPCRPECEAGPNESCIPCTMP